MAGCHASLMLNEGLNTMKFHQEKLGTAKVVAGIGEIFRSFADLRTFPDGTTTQTGALTKVNMFSITCYDVFLVLYFFNVVLIMCDYQCNYLITPFNLQSNMVEYSIAKPFR